LILAIVWLLWVTLLSCHAIGRVGILFVKLNLITQGGGVRRVGVAPP